MKQKHLLIVLTVLLVGCAYKGQQALETYIDEPETILRDPHFTNYQEASDHLESEYLKKTITYAEYVEKKKELDDKYAKEVHERDSIVAPGQ